MYDGQQWSLQPCPFMAEEMPTAAASIEAGMTDSVKRFLDGIDTDSDDGDAVSSFQHQ